MYNNTKKSRLLHGTNSILFSNNKQDSTPTEHDNQEQNWEHLRHPLSRVMQGVTQRYFERIIAIPTSSGEVI